MKRYEVVLELLDRKKHEGEEICCTRLIYANNESDLANTIHNIYGGKYYFFICQCIELP